MKNQEYIQLHGAASGAITALLTIMTAVMTHSTLLTVLVGIVLLSVCYAHAVITRK